MVILIFFLILIYKDSDIWDVCLYHFPVQSELSSAIGVSGSNFGEFLEIFEKLNFINFTRKNSKKLKTIYFVAPKSQTYFKKELPKIEEEFASKKKKERKLGATVISN